MALAGGRVSQVNSYYENLHGGGPSSQPLQDSSSQGLFGLMDHNKLAGEQIESLMSYPANHLPAISDPSSSSSGGGGGGGGGGGCLFFNSPSSVVDSHHSILNFKTSSNSILGSSMLSFDQGHHLMEEYGLFVDALDSNGGQLSHLNSLKNVTDPLLAGDRNCPSSAAGSTRGARKDGDRPGDERFSWVYSEKETGDGLQESKLLEGSVRKCPHTGGDVQPSKKQCSNKKVKNKTMPTKDPQSIAAKNRRERISERLKILQDLVPNGTKVDLVTMLEKAISYVKFLQLQVKVLATDEFWPSQGGKAPNISQVKEAIDAIISSQRNPSSK